MCLFHPCDFPSVVLGVVVVVVAVVVADLKSNVNVSKRKTLYPPVVLMAVFFGHIEFCCIQ